MARPAALGPSRPEAWVLRAGFGVSAVQLTLGSLILFLDPPRPQASVRLGALGLGVQLWKLGVKADEQHGRALHLFRVWGTHSGRGCRAACWPLSSAEPVSLCPLSHPVTPASVSPPSPLTPDLRIPVSSWINLPSSSRSLCLRACLWVLPGPGCESGLRRLWGQKHQSPFLPRAARASAGPASWLVPPSFPRLSLPTLGREPGRMCSGP